MLNRSVMADQEHQNQLELFFSKGPVVHYYDRNGALRSGYLVRIIKKGRKKGMPVVRDSSGKLCTPSKIHHIEDHYH